jgi:soluble lytic murein transglycosylase-like protein
MGYVEPSAGFSLLLVVGFWLLFRILRCILEENHAVSEANRHLVGSDLLWSPAASASRLSHLKLGLLRHPAWRVAAAVTGFSLVCAIPASPEAHECPLRPLRFREVIEHASQPTHDPASPCSLISLRYARQLAEQSANRVQVTPELVLAMIYHESRFAPCAVSSSGAQGLMQLKPGTASEVGVTDAFNPADNVAGGTRYLKYLLDRYHGDTALALAAYKDGTRRVDNRRGRSAPLSTQQYVHNIMQLADDMADD